MSQHKTITIHYKCQCMQNERTLVVPQRTSDQDVVQWLENVANEAITNDHRSVSPLCQSRKMEYCKIPFDESVPVGTVPTKH